jgi:hypothetical protein
LCECTCDVNSSMAAAAIVGVRARVREFHRVQTVPRDLVHSVACAAGQKALPFSCFTKRASLPDAAAKRCRASR